MYAHHTQKALEHQSIKGSVGVQAFCYMDNHVHMLCRYLNGSVTLSKFMQRAHASFGSHYNRKHGRKGKVAIERPKTPVVEDESHLQIDVHMYIEANPLRAGMVRTLKKLKGYRFSSYQYYAHGVKNRFTKGLTEPAWYRSLGETPIERQKAYRKLFRDYLQRTGWIGKAGNRTDKEEFSQLVEQKQFIKDVGSPKFLNERKAFHLKYFKAKVDNQSLLPMEVLEKLLEAD